MINSTSSEKSKDIVQPQEASESLISMTMLTKRTLIAMMKIANTKSEEDKFVLGNAGSFSKEFGRLPAPTTKRVESSATMMRDSSKKS